MNTGLAILVVLAGPAHAEGRNDPFLRCDFGADLQITLAERGDNFAWLQNGAEQPAQIVKDEGSNMVMIYTASRAGGIRSMTVSQGDTGDQAAPEGAAILITHQISVGGELLTAPVSGQCEAAR